MFQSVLLNLPFVSLRTQQYHIPNFCCHWQELSDWSFWVLLTVWEEPRWQMGHVHSSRSCGCANLAWSSWGTPNINSVLGYSCLSYYFICSCQIKLGKVRNEAFHSSLSLAASLSPHTHQLPLDCLNCLDFMSLGLLNEYQEKPCRGGMLTIRTVPLPCPFTRSGELCLVQQKALLGPGSQLSSCVCRAGSAAPAWATSVLKLSKDWQDHQVVTGKGCKEPSPQESPRHPWNIIWFLI